MSKNELTASDAAPAEQENDSVYDFLYHDVRRVGSFLAQLEDAGHLKQVRQTDSVVKGTKRGWNFKLAGGVPELGNAEVSGERTPAQGGSESSERVYDPLWTNARTLLDYLTERAMIGRSLQDASIGQFLLVSGQIILLDLEMLKGAWERPAIQKLMRANISDPIAQTVNRAQRRAAGRTAQTQPDHVETLISLLSILPHSVQARMISDTVNVWCGLDAESIVGSSGDLILKHGSLIGGEWFMLGVLDATPYDASYRNEEGEDEADIFARIAETGVGQLAARLAPAARSFMGRPPSAYGMTPLLIFRDVPTSITGST